MGRGRGACHEEIVWVSSYRSVSSPAPCSRRGKVYPDEQDSAERYNFSSLRGTSLLRLPGPHHSFHLSRATARDGSGDDLGFLTFRIDIA